MENFETNLHRYERMLGAYLGRFPEATFGEFLEATNEALEQLGSLCERSTDNSLRSLLAGEPIPETLALFYRVEPHDEVDMLSAMIQMLGVSAVGAAMNQSMQLDDPLVDLPPLTKKNVV